MIVRIGLFEALTPEVSEASRRNLFERFLPALRSQPGFVAGYWGEAADGRSVSITVWESEEALRQGAMNANAVPLLAGQDPTLIAAPSSVDSFAVYAWAQGQPVASDNVESGAV
ncbi:MAG: antibiotic biosynthesis monooxygenase [Chloroflexi bacterium]|nr:antibiotic biosynthesis monooxygenase [Chloroflexota bacterium]